MYIDVHVSARWSALNGSLFFSTDFREVHKFEIL
jgi:hypothetical protein